MNGLETYSRMPFERTFFDCSAIVSTSWNSSEASTRREHPYPRHQDERPASRAYWEEFDEICRCGAFRFLPTRFA